MKATKIVMAAAAALGIVAVCALPYFSMEGFSLKYWDFRQAPTGGQVYVALVGFGLVLAMGALAIAQKGLARWSAIVGIVGSALTLLMSGVRKGLTGEGGMSTAIGGKILFLSAVACLIASILGAIKPDKAKA